jgi:hypothetical protein
MIPSLGLSMSDDPYETWARLKIANLEAELTAVRASFAEYLRARGRSVDATSVAPSTPTNVVNVSVNDIAVDPLRDLPLSESILGVLKSFKGPKTPHQIWIVLESAGREIESKSPIDSVTWALKKLRTKNKDVVSLGLGQWDLRSNYTKTEFAELMAKRAGKGGRTTAEHKARTLAGMERAKEGGKHIGAPLLSEEKLKSACRSIKGGTRKMRAIRDAGLSASVFYYYKARFDLEAWDCQTWPPPPRRKNVSERLRLIQGGE